MLMKELEKQLKKGIAEYAEDLACIKSIVSNLEKDVRHEGYLKTEKDKEFNEIEMRMEVIKIKNDRILTSIETIISVQFPDHQLNNPVVDWRDPNYLYNNQEKPVFLISLLHLHSLMLG